MWYQLHLFESRRNQRFSPAQKEIPLDTVRELAREQDNQDANPVIRNSSRQWK